MSSQITAVASVDIDAGAEDVFSHARQRPRRENRRPPLRYRHEQPAAPACLPPPIERLSLPNIPGASQVSTASPERQILNSRSNTFGLFRRYFAASFPDHDPEAEIQPQDMSEVVDNHDKSDIVPASMFAPYPNENAFLLGEWYWNHGIQKTQDSFRKLINIVSGTGFKPADVRDISWKSVNKYLGESRDSEELWLGEPDAGWTETVITLPIPFQKNSPKPGLKEYTFPPFQHRSIVSILKEKMANLHDFRHFHLEPYELRWRRKNMAATESTRVHGELYTSPAFLEAHEEIRTLAGEPGCSLPRVLIGLMFGSDATHLTSFGTASLWPCYMYFGNESKNRRCKPTCNLCNHIAYFQKV